MDILACRTIIEKALRGQEAAMLALLKELVDIDSPTDCAEGVRRVGQVCADWLAKEGFSTACLPHAPVPEDEAWLSDLQGRKTGSLLSAACAMGAAAAGAGEDKTELAIRYGAALGAAFQIRDDMLDVLSTEAELGKPIGSDAEEGKLTFMSLYGEEKCAEMVERLTQLAVELAKELGSDFLAQLALRLSDRRN